MKNGKVALYDVWDGWNTLEDLEDVCYNLSHTHIIIDCAKESRMYLAAFQKDHAKRIVNLRNHNSVNGNKLSLIIGGYKFMPDHYCLSDVNINTYQSRLDIINNKNLSEELTEENRIISVHDREFTDPWDSCIIYGLFDTIETWPNFFLTWQGYKILEGSYNKADEIYDYKNLFCIKNRVAKPHRLYMLNELERRNLLIDNQWSLLDPHDTWEQEMAKTLGEDKSQWTFTHGKKILQEESGMNDLYKDQPSAYLHSFMDLVVETFSDCNFYTEKTTCPLLYRKPFLICGAPYINYDLQNLGFVLYDEIFDYSFDKIESFRERSAALADELLRLQKLDLDYNKVYTKLLPKLEHNLARVLQLMYYDEYLPRTIREYGDQVAQEIQVLDPLGRLGWFPYIDGVVGRNQAAVDLIRKSKYLMAVMKKNYKL